MLEEKRKHKRFSVSWRGRIVLPNKELHDVKIFDISLGGLAINFQYALAVGTPVSVEFYVKYQGEQQRIRARTHVVFNNILSDSRGAKLGLQFTEISHSDIHTIANVLNLMGDDE